MSAVERSFYSHAGRVLGRLEDGHNTEPVRHEAWMSIESRILTPESQLHTRLWAGIVEGWRREGDITKLDTDKWKISKTP